MCVCMCVCMYVYVCVLLSIIYSLINRKLQMKPLKWNGDPSQFDDGDGGGSSGDGGGSTSGGDGSSGGKSGGQNTINSKADLRATQLLVILKWGGDLTPLGAEQAEKVGKQFRNKMYPSPTGGGILRLHATYRHDLKIKASDEGRVMKTAAAFTKGLLELEGQLTPILGKFH